MTFQFIVDFFGQIRVGLWLFGFSMMIFITLSAMACQKEIAYERVSEATLKPGQAIPAPVGEVILAISGEITNTNEGDKLVFDLPTLEKLGLAQYSVPDPWLQQEVTYTGVLLADVLKVAGAPGSTTIIYVMALDGYNADIPVTDVKEWPILLATRADGQYMTIENSGPTRIIYPYDSYPDITAARNRSVWNIEFVEVK